MEDKYEGRICPIPKSEYPHILLAHGGGGRLMHKLIEEIFAEAFRSPELETAHDGAVVPPQEGKLVLTTDSYVVRPLFFPGGDIGKLAVCGTVNDLLMCGARPLYLSTGFILEEGLVIEELWKICLSMRRTADDSKVRIITGDTKVVERGKGDGLYINTAGIGVIDHDLEINPFHIQRQDVILVNGDIGRHGIAVMAQREGLAFETQIESDCAALVKPIMGLLAAGIQVHCLRDLTRGGLASALVELSTTSGLSFQLNENAIPICEAVRSACEILGYDPLYVANEGRFVAFIPAAEAERAIEIINSSGDDFRARIIGQVLDKPASEVALKTSLGTLRAIDMLSGEQLPRIC